MQNWKRYLPIQLTFSRIYILVVLIPLILHKGFWWDIGAAALFALASLTDAWDGALARKWNLVSSFGKFMDPVADKILVSSVLIVLLYMNKIDPWLVIVLLGRDTFIGGVRSAAAADKLIIDAKPTGKWKTGFQMVGIAMVILETFPGLPWLGDTGRVVLWISVVLSLVSGYQYWQSYNEIRKT